MNKIAFFIFIFLFCTALGLYVGSRFIPVVGDINPATGQSVDDASGALYFLTVILVGTAVLLLVLRFYKGNLLFKLFEIYVIFIGSMLVWDVFIYDISNASPALNDMAVLLLAAAVVIARFVKRTFTVGNMTLAIAIGGVGGVLGSYMGFIPALLFVIALGTYDIIAVFKTKHMVKLADQSRLRQLPVMFETPSKGIKTGPRKGMKEGQDILGLGTGDVAIPLIFFVGILRTFNDWLLVGGAVIGAMIGLGLTIWYVTQVKRIALPALPPIMGMSIIGFGITLFLKTFL